MAADEDQTGLSPGTYTVVATDENSCPIEASYTITEPDALAISGTLSDRNGFSITCNGDDDGAIDITVTGGTSTYTYAWTTLDGSGLVAADEDQTGLGPGTYTVVATDENSCLIEASYVITEPKKIDFTGVLSDYTGFNISKFGGADGKITITPTGGSAGYIYAWTTLDGSGLVAEDKDQIALTVGTYTLKLTDSNGCNITKSFTLTEPDELLISLGVDPTNILCFGDSTGLLKVIITQSSVPPFKYTLNGTDYTGTVIEEIIDFKNDLNHTFSVKAGKYTITVLDTNGASKTSKERTYTHPDILALSAIISKFDNFNISCTGANDGSIDITVTGGELSSGDYKYIWTSDLGTGFEKSTQDQSGLGPGTYTVLVEDENGCKLTKSFEITEPEKMVYRLDSKKDISCFGANDGSIDITLTKGGGVYNYEWSTADGDESRLDKTAQDQSGLGPGNYKLIITANCEIIQKVFEIIEPIDLTITLDEKTNILCFGDASGKILVTVNGGTAPFNYEWIDNFGNKYNRDIGNVFNKGDLSNIPSGIYSLKVTDANGCIRTLEDVELTQAEDLLVSFEKTDLNCYNQNDGTATVKASGGVSPYTYDWSDQGSGPNRTNLDAGTYTVTITDKNLCVKELEIVINEAPLYTIVPVVEAVSCFGANDGSIKLNLDGGNAPVKVTWSDDPSAGENRFNLKPGNYSVVLTDGVGCVINETFQIIEPIELELSGLLTNALDCKDPLSGAIDLQVVGGNPPYEFLWSNGEITEDLTNIGANNYSVKVTDAKGCQATKVFLIKRQVSLVAELDTNLRIVCESREIYQVNKLTISGGVFPYTVKWSDGDVLDDRTMETKKEGTYQVDITDDTGCTVSILFDVVLPVLGYPDFDYDSFYLQTFDALTFNDPITFENLSTEKYLSVEWDFGDGNTSTENDPVHSYLKPGSYDVTIYVTYIGGCVYSLTKTIYIGNSYELEVPNAFTPNGDGHNDFFKPEYYGFTEIDLKVFDLWGTLIYYEKADTDQLVGWNARINGKPAENGNYIYQVTGTAYNKESVFKNGPFTLLK